MEYQLPKILVFGATGRTGRLIVKKLLDKGYTVTAFVRDTKKLKNIRDGRFTQIPGSIHDYDAVLHAVQENDLVISALGTSNYLPNTIVSTGVENILKAMKESGVNNLIFQSSLGVGESKGQVGLFYNLFLLPFLLRFVFKDKERQEKLITSTSVDWTIVRPAHFIPFSIPKKYRAILPPDRPRILPLMSREHTAEFIVKECGVPKHSRKKVSLSYF
jgi:putative NADH-flavin reductase